MKRKPFALTGNMGCGKTTVANLLAKIPGVAVFNTDEMAKQVITDPEHRTHITTLLDLPRTVTINTADVAKIIFVNRDRGRRFEGFVYPRVSAMLKNALAAQPDDTICIVELALLYELNLANQYSAVIVASCCAEEQRRRLVAFRGKTWAEIETRLALQLSSKEKLRRADFVIDTNCAIDELRERVSRLHAKLVRFQKEEQ